MATPTIGITVSPQTCSLTVATLPYSLDAVYGAYLIGVGFSILLFGVLTVQIYYYFEHFESDARWMKALVNISLFVLRFSHA